MKSRLTLSVAVCSLFLSACQRDTPPEIKDPVERQEAKTAADRFARMALDCVHRPFPNKISHVMNSADDVAAPKEMTPAFYGCFDWHSAVHGHWLLVRILRTQPETVLKDEIRAALAESFTAENIAKEVEYYSAEGRAGFERPYGIAWFLQLVSELEESKRPKLKEWRETLRPLEDKIVERIESWLPKLAYPVRVGTHNQSAFSFGLMLDYARTVGNANLENLLVQKTIEFYYDDKNCPISYEPSGEDFLSPCLMEADLVRRVMPENEFAPWLSTFLPDIPLDPENGSWLEPGIVLDPEDGKLVHLDGVNLSRAWAMEGIASALPDDDPRKGALLAAAANHKKVGIEAVTDAHYSGSHWLASFATYLTTKRGVSIDWSHQAKHSKAE